MTKSSSQGDLNKYACGWGTEIGQGTVAFHYWKGKIVYEGSVITWKNIYNLSGKAGNKLYTQCIHKYIKKKKLCTGKGLEGNISSYL